MFFVQEQQTVAQSRIAKYTNRCFHEALLDENSDIHDRCCDWSGFEACSNVTLKDQTLVNGGSTSQTNEATIAGEVNTNDSHFSSFFDITYFDFDSADLSADARKVSEKAVDKFLTNPSGRVVISGHADERGTREYNLALGHLRASAVADCMVANGIDGLRINKVSFGKEKPLLKGSNEEARSKNRRVEINGE